jgi:hypothetical protein
VKELEARAEMAESNLRTLLAAAKGAGRDAPVGDTEMEAILGVLKGGAEGSAPGGGVQEEPSAPGDEGQAEPWGPGGGEPGPSSDPE